MENIIEFQNVSFRYSSEKEIYSVKNLNLEIKKGEVVVLCGLSGCGKTTVTRLINGLAPHFFTGGIKGNVIVDGKNTKEIELSALSKICGSVFQNPKSQFFNTDTTGELAFACENLAFPKEKTAECLSRTIQDFSLEKLIDRDIFKLSGGEKQQIACGSIYAINPKIYVFDEPSSNMDAQAIMRLKSIIKKLKEEGKTIVIAEHRLYFLLDIADRFLYFADGELKESYTSQSICELSDVKRQTMGLRVTKLEDIKFDEKHSVDKTAIEMRKISCVRGRKEVLNIEQLSLPKHSVIAIIGENGAGKSTFAEVLTGRLKANGEILNNGVKLKPKERTKKSYMVMQDVNRQLFCETVKKEIMLSAKKVTTEDVDELMTSMDIAQFEERHPASLSGGQKQRVAICAGIFTDKEIMIYDEPTSGLDGKSMNSLCQLIVANKNKHNVSMIITHDLELVIGCCDHVLHLSNGEISDFYKLDDEGFGKVKNYFIEDFKVKGE